MTKPASSQRPVSDARETSFRRTAREFLLIEQLWRGAPASDSSSPASESESGIPNAGDSTKTNHHTRRFVCDSRTALALLDFLLITLIQGAFFFAADGRMDFSVSAEAPFIM